MTPRITSFQTVPDKLNEKSFWLTVKDGMLDASDVTVSSGTGAVGGDQVDQLNPFSFVVEQFAQKKPAG